MSKDTARVRWRCFDPARALTPAIFRGDTLRARAERKATTDGEHRRRMRAPTDVALETRAACGDPARSRARGRGVPLVRHDGVHRRRRRRQRRRGDADARHLGRQLLRHARTRLPLQRQAHVVRHRPVAVRRAAAVRAARQHARADDRVSGHGRDAAPVLAVGAAGNAWITSAVYQTLVGVLDFGLTPQQALELPRFLPSRPRARATRARVRDRHRGRLRAGDDAAAARDGLHAERHLAAGELRMGYGAAVSVRQGPVTAGADPRRRARRARSAIGRIGTRPRRSAGGSLTSPIRIATPPLVVVTRTAGRRCRAVVVRRRLMRPWTVIGKPMSIPPFTVPVSSCAE